MNDSELGASHEDDKGFFNISRSSFALARLFRCCPCTSPKCALNAPSSAIRSRSRLRF